MIFKPIVAFSITSSETELANGAFRKAVWAL
jgi:hypothetical protein